MAEPYRDDRIERLVRDLVPVGFGVERGSLWLKVTPESAALPEHGWKLHVSSRVHTFPDLVRKAVPILLAEGCVFKLARSQQVLQQLNDGTTFPASVGKAVTIYPDQRRLRDLGLRLAETLHGHEGPRILSDRQVTKSSPVYYRYGLLTPKWAPDARGRLVTQLSVTGGADFESVATLSYRQPPWATDPFTGQTGHSEPGAGHALLGDRYRVTEGIRESARGNVYRAIDQHSGATVVVKQARALVAEDGALIDARLRLRNERRVLQALAGARGVPRLIDHFRQGDDEFLVVTDCGAHTLDQDVRENGPYRTGAGAGARSLDQLAARLARIITEVHERGVIISDISPANIVLAGDDLSMVDFGHSAYGGVHLPGRTPGYAPARQVRGEPPQRTDDLHALGMTLFFASRGAHPVCLGDDPELPATRALQVIAHAVLARGDTVPSRALSPVDTPDPDGPDPDGPEPPAGALTGVMAAVTDLISGDTTDACTALRRLASQEPYPRPSRATTLPAAPVLTPELTAEITASLVSDLLASAEMILLAPGDVNTAHDLSLYSGAAGIGLELLKHLEHQPVAGRVHDLVEFTARADRLASLPPGLFTGATGVHLFLRQARDRGFDSTGTWAHATVPPRDWQPQDHDLISGAAGVGLGHLYSYRAVPARRGTLLAGGSVAWGHPRPRWPRAPDGPEPPAASDPADLDVAWLCARALIDPGTGDARFSYGAAADGAVDPSLGRAHGLAGVVDFLLSFAAVTGDDVMRAAAAKQAHHLAEGATSLIWQARGPATVPLALSWCRGLAGIGQTLLRATTMLDDPFLAGVAKEAGVACLANLPRITWPGQCCGIAGIGNFMIDLAVIEQDDYWWDAVHRVAIHLLLQSAGPLSHPIFTESGPSPDSLAASWARGTAGLLGFFRRFAASGGQESLPVL